MIGCTAALVVLVPLTVVELVLIHLDRVPAPRCLNALDVATQHGECQVLLQSGEFSCEHDFCPGCVSSHEGFQAHECDLSCDYCPEAASCPEEEHLVETCVNQLDLETELGQCDLLIADGHFSCELDFCSSCEGSTRPRAGAGSGGHQSGACDRSCNLCTSATPKNNCTLAGTLTNDELDAMYNVPGGYVWATPLSSEVAITIVVLLLNGFTMATALCQDFLVASPDTLDFLRTFQHSPGLSVFFGVASILGTLTALVYGIAATQIVVLDLCSALYVISCGMSSLWSARFPWPHRRFYVAGLLPAGFQFMLVLVFLGFDYDLGTAILGLAFWLSFLPVPLSVCSWLAAVWFSCQRIVLDGLFFWSALFGLRWTISGGLVVLAASLRLGADFLWIKIWRAPSSSSVIEGARGRVVLPAGAKTVLTQPGKSPRHFKRDIEGSKVLPLVAALVSTGVAPMLLLAASTNPLRRLRDEVVTYQAVAAVVLSFSPVFVGLAWGFAPVRLRTKRNAASYDPMEAGDWDGEYDVPAKHSAAT